MEVPIHVSFESFNKQLFLDALVQEGAVFEFKTVEALTSKHRSQLLHYLLLADLPRGKLVNVRSLTHLLGGESVVLQDVDVVADGVVLGKQKFHMAVPGVAFRMTSLSDRPGRFETHAHRLLDHTALTAIQWINTTRREVAFKTIRR